MQRKNKTAVEGFRDLFIYQNNVVLELSISYALISLSWMFKYRLFNYKKGETKT